MLRLLQKLGMQPVHNLREHLLECAGMVAVITALCAAVWFNL